MPLIEGGFNIEFPEMVTIRQNFESRRIDDIEKAVWDELHKPEIRGQFRPGQSVAITVGSRGIANIARITKSAIDTLKGFGVEPFIIPAMGSHGGASPEGQMEVLASYGVTEESMGVPIRAEMDVVEVGKTPDGVPVYVSKPAMEADGILVMGRVKPHTAYRGKNESGLIKMMVIGLGKHKGATTIHHQGFSRFAELIPAAGRVVLEKAPVLAGLAIVENGYDETMVLQAVHPNQFEEEDSRLLEIARKSMARILFDEFDLLIVEEIGKNISGDGMDPNVTGRYIPEALDKLDHIPKIQKLVVLDLTEATHGNANGMGMADVVTRRLVDKINYEYTYANAITSTELRGTRIPTIMETDREAIVVGLKTCNGVEPQNARVVRIKNTLELSEIQISTALLPEAAANPAVEIVGKPVKMQFTEDGRLI